MKNFFRTIGGKVLLFIICTISVILFALSFGGWLVVYNESENIGVNIYKDSIEAISEKEIKKELYSAVYQNLQNLLNGEEVGDYGFEYEVRDKSGKIVYKSGNTLSDEKYTFSFKALSNTEIDDVMSHGYSNHLYAGYIYGVANPDYEMTISVIPGSYCETSVAQTKEWVQFVYSFRYAVYIIGFTSLFAAIISFIGILCVAAKRPGKEGIYPGVLNKIPFDLLILVCALGMYFTASIFMNNRRYMNYSFEIVVAGLIAAAMIPLMLGLAMSIAARVKQHNLIKNTVIYRIVRIISKFFRWLMKALPLTWKIVLLVLVICLINFAAFNYTRYQSGKWMIFFFIETIILIVIAIYISYCVFKIQKGGEELADGNLEYKINTTRMPRHMKKHADNLNHIGEGMALAVEEKIKSERLKTQLITNVSHDIKTPLTSIINYAALINEKVQDDTTLKGYSEVLMRQSEKLKRLLEDLVEASKASTGNLDVDLTACDAAVFIEQASGEYEEKFKNAKLELLTIIPDYKVTIMADGRRMWRIFDNLMNNICKYAQAGTRVYLSLEKTGNHAVITFRNTSREPLNMTEEELFERFTRGDSSRNTEGNGLGLSIAKSMAELQGGSLKVHIDGDLFKAILTLPMAE